MKRILISDSQKLYRALSSVAPLYAPMEKAGEVNFALYDGEGVVLDRQTVKSPKDFFFPQSEDLMKFKVDGQKIEIIDARKESAPFIVFGVRACDYKAFSVLDNVFLQDPLDTYYQTKREAATVVTLACGRPEESCFCTVFGIDPTAPNGDATVWVEGDCLYLDARTEKGKELFEKITCLEDCSSEAVEKQTARTKEILKKLPFGNIDPSVMNESMLDSFRSDKWAELSEACLGCGTCTFVCPTCQCFDIREFVTHDGVKRFRCWDSCMYSDFTKTAGGQPRPTQTQRFRQRFMHKLVYYPANNNGLYSCVGCGRCVKKCPQHLNIVKVIKAFGGKKDE